MKAYKIEVIVEKEDGYNNFAEYYISSPDNCGSSCELCREEYEKVIGKEVIGKVTFILRKINGRAKEYLFPFCLAYWSGEKRDRLVALQMHTGRKWEYSKYLTLLKDVLDIRELEKWAGRDMFSIEMEYDYE